MHDPIYLQDEHRMLRDQLRRFIDEEVLPHGEMWERDGMVPRDIVRKMGELGFLGIRYPEAHGGAELDTIATMVLSEELGQSTFGGFAITVLVHTDMASPHLANAGTEAQKAKYLPKIISGELVTAVGVTEPDAGSDVAGIRTRATKTDGGWILNGSKMFITNGVYGDLYFVAAKNGEGGGLSREITMFILEKGTEGFSVARPLEKMGWRSSDTAELVFDNCFVPNEHVLGDVHCGFHGEGLLRRTGEQGHVRLSAIPRWLRLYAGKRHRANGPRCSRPIRWRRRLGSHTGESREAGLANPEQYQQPRYAGDGDGRRQHDGSGGTLNVDAVLLRDHVYQRAGR